MDKHATDPVTIAYVVKGFVDEARDIHDEGIHGLTNIVARGEIEMLSQVADLASAVDATFDGVDTANYDGCFAYEVAEPMGASIARHIKQMKKLPSEEEVTDEARGLVKEGIYTE